MTLDTATRAVPDGAKGVAANPAFLARIAAIVGVQNCSDAPDRCAFMSHDIWSKGAVAAFVASPGSTAELAAVVAEAAKAGVPLHPRGGGMSYTNGFTPEKEGGGIVDLARMNRIIEINADDMYVSVEAGCTWATMYDALRPLGLRTPFWGPLSGLTSTIGGGLSQNNAFFGAGVHGPATESVLSLTVVVGDGTIVCTGTAGGEVGKPFWRHYGPDLAGIFLGDAGALGFKAEATLRLVPTPAREVCASFEFSSREACAAAMADVARQDIASEVFGFDPNLQRVRMKRASLAADARSLINVIRKQGSVLDGLKQGAKVALAGRGFLDEAAYSLHFVVEGRSAAGVADDASFLKELCARRGGREIENSIPKILRANPFTPLNNMIGPEGERWVPVHGIVPMSEGPAVWAEIEATFDAMRAELDAHSVTTGYLVTSLGTTGYLIEPVFIWPEELFAIHEASVEKSWLDRLPRHKSNPAATAVVARARKAAIDVFTRRGGAHFQVGRAFPYFETRAPATRRLLLALKRALDPAGIINPGSLGIGRNQKDEER